MSRVSKALVLQSGIIKKKASIWNPSGMFLWYPGFSKAKIQLALQAWRK